MAGMQSILRSHLQTIHGAVRQVLEDISDEDSLRTVGSYPNHIRWLTGHLVLYAQFAGAALGGSLGLPDGWAEMFKTGATPAEDTSQYPSMEALRERLFDYHVMVEEFLEHTDEAELQKEVELSPGWKSTRMGAVLFMAAHDFYHAGQIEVIRRELGRQRSFG